MQIKFGQDTITLNKLKSSGLYVISLLLWLSAILCWVVPTKFSRRVALALISEKQRSTEHSRVTILSILIKVGFKNLVLFPIFNLYAHPTSRALQNHFGVNRTYQSIAPNKDLLSNELSAVPILLSYATTKSGNVTLEELIALGKLVSYSTPSQIIEIGTFNGRTTCVLAMNSQAPVFTIDLPPGSREYGYENVERLFDRSDFEFKERITAFHDDSGSFDYNKHNLEIDFAFIDGDHSYMGAKRDFENLMPNLKAGSIVVFHDITSWSGCTWYFNDLIKAGHEGFLIEGTTLGVLKFA